MKKILSIIVTVAFVTSLSACKKDYSCKALDSAEVETVFNCENCSKKDVEEYEKSIIDAGYASVSCEK